MKKLFAVLLGIMMIAAFMPVYAFAAGETDAATDVDLHNGDGLYYEIVSGSPGLLETKEINKVLADERGVYNIPVVRNTVIKIHYYEEGKIRQITGWDKDVAPSGLFKYASDAHQRVVVTFAKLWNDASYGYTNRIIKVSSKNAGNEAVTLKLKFVNKAAVDKLGELDPTEVRTRLVKYNSVKVSWDKVPGAQRYWVYMAKGADGEYAVIDGKSQDKDTSELHCTFSGLSAGTQYSFKVVPVIRYLNRIQPGNSAYAAIYTLKKPGNVTVVKSSGRAKVSWNNIKGETGYQISKSTLQNGTKIVLTVKNANLTSSAIDATRGKTYYYKVRAFKTVSGKKVYGPWSTTVKYTLK